MQLLPLDTMTRCYNTIGELAAIFMSTPPAPCRALGITEADWPLYVALEQERRDAVCDGERVMIAFLVAGAAAWA